MSRSSVAAGLLLPLLLLSCGGNSVEWPFPPAKTRAWWDGFSTQAPDAPVTALAVHDSSLIVGGYFQHAGPAAAAGIAAWDGQSWSALGTGLQRDDCPDPNCDAWAAAFTDFEGNLIAGGRFTVAGGVRAANIARWDGTSWSPLGEGLDGTVLALAVAGGRLVAGGEFTHSGLDSTVQHVAAWDGTRWQALGEGTNGVVRTLRVTGEGLVAGGDFTLAGTNSFSYCALWSGSAWSSMGNLDGPVYGLCQSQAWGGVEELFACGRAFTAPYSKITLAVRQGSIWDWISPRYAPQNPNAMVDFAGSLVVGGDGNFDASQEYLSGIARISENELLSPAGGVLGEVLALCVYRDHLYAGGRFVLAGNVRSPYIARWDE